ncbi:MAG: Crp/Fnr family transcriptional regulator [Planctomycetota bacterium]|jgi:CRP/FNR family transcriptional regulator
MTAQSMIHELFDRYPILGELSESHQQLFREHGQALKAPDGTMLFNVGSPCELFPLLTEGLIRVERLSESGRKIILYTVKPGDSCILTVSCLLGNSTYPAMGIVGEDVTGVAITREVFMRLIEDSLEFRTFVFKYFSERLAHLMELVEGLAWEKVHQRLAGVLGSKPDVVETTHQLLADELGSVREVISRTLKEYEAQGLVKLGRGKIQILDREGLRKIASM